MALIDTLSTARPARSGSRSLSRMIGAWKQRRALSRLDDSRLADIGVTRAEASREANRPIWDVPQTWRR